MKSVYQTAGILLLAIITASSGGVGQSAVITLAFPYGARSAAMGEVGTALADDASVIYFNPAGLAVPNLDFEGGIGSYFYEPLLPAFHLDELRHNSFSANYQYPGFEWGQFGAFRNFINMGENIWTDELGRPRGSANSYETVTGIGWGFDFKEIGIKNHYFGVTLKWYISALAPGISGLGSGIGSGMAFDVGYIWNMGHGFRLGATLMNMGPSVYYIDPDNADPIPFTVNFAVAYKKSFEVEGIRFVSLAGEVRYDREIVKNYGEGHPDPFYRAIWTDLLHDTSETPKFELQQINRHYGGEITFFNTFSIRMGYLIDIAGARYEQHHGFGIRLFNHVSFDWARIYAPEGFMKNYAQRYDPNAESSSGARNTPDEMKIHQWSVTFTRLLKWSKDDLAWWREHKE